MCLYRVKDKIPKNIKYGYKIFKFKYNTATLHSLYFGWKLTNPFILDKWYYDLNSDESINTSDDKKYKPGFHCWTNKKEAIKYKKHCLFNIGYSLKIFKVEVKDIVAYGEQVNQNVVVCKQIKLIEEIK